MNKIRYFNENVGPLKENEIKAFQKSIELSKEIENVDEITLLIHTKNNTGYLERIFGTENIKALFKGAKMKDVSPLIKIETTRTIGDLPQKNRIIVAFGLRSDELNVYDDYYYCKAIIAHQWSPDSVTDWANNWGAINLEAKNNKEETVNKITLPDIIIQKAFKELTNSINRATGISHPNDEEQCKTYIRALKKYNYDLNSKEIFAFLTRELHWDTDDAKDVIKLIDKLNSGGYFQGGQKTDLKRHIKRWSEEK